MSRTAQWIRRVILIAIAAAAVIGVAASLGPKPISVEAGTALRGPLVLTVDGAGRAKMVDKQTISAPVAGELERISLRPGDSVTADQVVARILPALSQPLDARSRAEVTARLGAARAGLSEANRNVERAQISLELARSEAERARKLVSTQSVPVRTLELAEAEEKARGAELELAKTSVGRVRLEAQAVAAALGDPTRSRTATTQPIEVRAQSSGVVLRVHNDSAGLVQPGSPLLDIGDPRALELVVDLPTQSAVRVKAGAAVSVDGLGNGAVLAGAVKLVEPGAFTKVTALGVEEQRVNVIVVAAGDLEKWSVLGDGFAADAHIEVHKAADVLKVPAGAVFREGSGYAVFTIANGRARLAPIETGARSAAEVEVTKGLAPGDKVVVHPSDKLEAGLEVLED
ncbi:MAG: HlyD family efflux transporter periplasmic adaptor subunit [Myxococcota bacterium]|jgi:HlyD family secretion protein|nr:HlyD family efflux transporter periplasmic adaptor subunit [Myxococcota bacterium]